MKKVFSKRFTLNLWDIVKAIGLFFITNVLELGLQALQMWQEDQTKPINWKEMIVTATIATVGYLIKNFFTVAPKSAIQEAAKEAGITNIK